MDKKNIIPQIIGILVNEGLNAKDVIEILDETKEVFLSRSWHINSRGKAD